MMGQFLGRSLKKCLHFFPLFELGFLYTTTTYFQKMSSIRKLAIQLYYVLYTTLCCKKKIQIIQLCFSIFGFSLNTDGVFYIYLYLQQTLLKVHFFYLEKSHCTILCTLQMVLPNYDCHFDSAAISKNNPPLLAPPSPIVLALSLI